MFDEENNEFYLVSNKRNDILGFYLIKFDENEPSNYKFLTTWEQRLDIGNVNLNILRCYDNDSH